MNSKERVKLAFSHKEADRLPIGELYINSPVASEILGRTAYTGWGNVDCASALHLGTREDVIRDTLRVIRTAAPGGGLVISSSNTIHSSIPTKNYMYMLETVRKYGAYPLNIDL